MYLFYFFGVFAVKVSMGGSHAHAAHALAGAAHVLLSVNCHLGQHIVLFKLLIAARGLTDAAVRGLHAVGGIRLLRARPTRRLRLAAST